MSALAKETVSVSIKLAVHDDIFRLVKYGAQFWQETSYYKAGVAYNRDTVMAMVAHLIDEGVVLYAEDADDRVIGLMLVIVTPFLMNANYLSACEWVFYVDPEYRRGGLGVALIDEAEEILREQDVKFFTMVSLSNVAPEAAAALYKSLGFKPAETSYLKDLSWQP